MIEDALKSTRALHRLIMTVSLVTLVFALSLDQPTEKVTQRDAIEALIGSDFLAYDNFVAERVAAFSLERLEPIGTALNERIKSGGFLIFNLDDLGEAFSKPLHVGKLLTGELALADLGGATLTQLDALSGLGLSSDVQIVIPRVEDLTAEIETFLKDNTGAGKRVDTIRIGIEDFEFNAESFLPGSETIAGLYFELVDAVRVGGAPAFSASFVADIVTLPNSSFIYWLTNNSDLTWVVSMDGNRVLFAPSLKGTPTGFREEKLGLLHRRLSDEIASAGPEKQSATILGTKVPGLLIVIASPLTLLVLSYYFTNHTGHLVQLVKADAKAFKGFAWMPLTIRRDIPLFHFAKTKGHYRISGWALETITSAIILPVASLAVLYWQLSQFGGVGRWPSLIISIAGIGIAMFGLITLNNINEVRNTEEAS